MDPTFILLFPIAFLLFLATDWSRLTKMQGGVKLTYAALMTLTFGLFAARAAGVEIPLPPRFFVQYISPAVESMIGIR